MFYISKCIYYCVPSVVISVSFLINYICLYFVILYLLLQMDAEFAARSKMRQFELECTIRSLEHDMMFQQYKLPGSDFVSSIKYHGVPILPPVVSSCSFCCDPLIQFDCSTVLYAWFMETRFPSKLFSLSIPLFVLHKLTKVAQLTIGSL